MPDLPYQHQWERRAPVVPTSTRYQTPRLSRPRARVQLCPPSPRLFQLRAGLSVRQVSLGTQTLASSSPGMEVVKVTVSLLLPQALPPGKTKMDARFALDRSSLALYQHASVSTGRALAADLPKHPNNHCVQKPYRPIPRARSRSETLKSAQGLKA
jgi:hypothetical protein